MKSAAWMVVCVVGCQQPTSGTSSAQSTTAPATTTPTTTTASTAVVASATASIAPAPAASVSSVSVAASSSVKRLAPISVTAKSSDPDPAYGSGGLGLQGIGQGGGCPCGCDHSKDMVDEMHGQSPSLALATISDSLHTIGEREDAGYITERMVRHRLRLLAYGRDLGSTIPGRFTSVPGPRAFGVSATNGNLRVHADLMVHGETTEIVRGKEKDLHASFVVRLDLENVGPTRVVLAEPILDGSVALPVSRWYLAGTDGEPWNGSLASGASVIAYVIGYVGEPVLPGTELAATVSLDWMTIPLKTRARAHWNDTP